MIEFNSLGNHPNVALFNVDARLKVEIEREAYRRGLSGIFFDGDSLDLLLKGIQTIFKGELWYSRDTMAKPLAQKVSFIRQE